MFVGKGMKEKLGTNQIAIFTEGGKKRLYLWLQSRFFAILCNCQIRFLRYLNRFFRGIECINRALCGIRIEVASVFDCQGFLSQKGRGEAQNERKY
jgi:hypothetical protein